MVQANSASEQVEGFNDEESQFNFGIGEGIKPKEFPGGSPGGLVVGDKRR